MSYAARPEWISAEEFRAIRSESSMREWFVIDGITPRAFIDRCERAGKAIKKHPIRTNKYGIVKHGYRVIDLWARAKADGVSFEDRGAFLSRLIESTRLDMELLEAQRAAIKARHACDVQKASVAYTGKSLLTEREIVEARQPLRVNSGVYFLIRNFQVIYVGQSIDVDARIRDHLTDKKYDSYVCISCHPAQLDFLESIYIHTLRPERNAKSPKTGKFCAPLCLDEIMKIAQRYSDASPFHRRSERSAVE